jgi:hypothetical protein
MREKLTFQQIVTMVAFILIVLIIVVAMCTGNYYKAYKPLVPEPQSADVPELSPIVYERLRNITGEAGYVPEIITMAAEAALPASDTDMPAEKEYTADAVIVTMIAQMLYGEGRGVKSDTEVAAIAWVPFNRYDNESPYDWPHDLKEIITQPDAFVGYDPNNPVWDRLYRIAEDVYIRWLMEQDGQTDIGRVLPSEYTYFCSDGTGLHNVFRDAFRKNDANIWDWSLPSPYES